MPDPIFPTVKKSIESFIEDEEGSIPASKLAAIGSAIILLSLMIDSTLFAKHSSHRSHSSHSSHSSGSGGYHGSHVSHSSHSSHASYSTHSSVAPSNGGGEATPTPAPAPTPAPQAPAGPTLPTANSLQTVNPDVVAQGAAIKLPKPHLGIEVPATTPPVDGIPALGVPLPTPKTDAKALIIPTKK